VRGATRHLPNGEGRPVRRVRGDRRERSRLRDPYPRGRCRERGYVAWSERP